MNPIVDKDKSITKDDIKIKLAHLGLEKGDIVMVHSSLSAFGKVEGGPDAVIDALLETVGVEGTVMMPTYSTNKRRLDDGTEEILRFDPKDTPVWTGVIPETFRKRKGVIRSTHPTSSLAAIGPKAEELIQSLEKLVDLNGYVLCMGVGLEANSAMHIAEAIAKPPQYMERIKAYKTSGFWGWIQNLVLIFFIYSETVLPQIKYVRKHARTLRNKHFQKHSMIVSRPPKAPWADLTKMDIIYRKTGIMKMEVIGRATCRLLECKPMIELFAEALEKNPDVFYAYRPSTYDLFVQRSKNK